MPELGPNRYIPPTFNYARNGEIPDYRNMNWNTMQQYYMPQQNNDTFTNQYMGNLQNMLQQYQGQRGNYSRQPSMPFRGQSPFGNNGPQQPGGGGIGQIRSDGIPQGGQPFPGMEYAGGGREANPYGQEGYGGIDFNRQLMMQMLGGMSQQQMFPASYSSVFGFGREQPIQQPQQPQQSPDPTQYGFNPGGIPGGK